MPYIKQEGRPKLDKIVDDMLDAELEIDGDFNYLLFSFFCRYMVWKKPSYNKIKSFRAELDEVRGEIKERFLNIYEQRKRFENGEVPGAEELSRMIRDY